MLNYAYSSNVNDSHWARSTMAVPCPSTFHSAVTPKPSG